MKTRILVIAAALCAFTSGCTSTAPSVSISPDQGAAAVRIAVSTGATLALAKNPKYIDAASALVAGIDVAIAANTTVTPEGISSFVRSICTRYNVPAVDVAVFINLANSVYQAYTTQFKTQVVSSTDPTVLLYVNAFKNGINDAVLASTPPKP